MTNDTLTEMIDRLSKECRIEKKDFRLKIESKLGKMIYSVLDKKDVVKTVTLKQALDLSGIMGAMKETVIKSYLERSITYLANKYNVQKDVIDVRICIKKDTSEPTSYLFIDKMAMREVEIKELVIIN